MKWGMRGDLALETRPPGHEYRMESFEELELAASIVEALASEGVGRPTALQCQAIPVLRRGSSAILRAGPGAGLLVAYGTALLDRLPADNGRPAALILTPERERARLLALSLARLAIESNHRIGALGVPWDRAEESDILFLTPEDLTTAVASARVKLDLVTALVLDGAAAVLGGSGEVEALNDVLQSHTGEGLQIVVMGDPLTPSVRRWVDKHVRRGIFLPAEAGADRTETAPVARGTLSLYTLEGDVDRALTRVVSGLLAQEHPHVLVFARSEDRLADIGDMLTLHGFSVGRPGELDSTIWLGADPLEVRAALAEQEDAAQSVAIISADVPTDADELDRRHGGGAQGTVVARPSRVPHLRRAAREAGYSISPVVLPSVSAETETARFLSRVESALEEEDLVPYLGMLEPVIRSRGAAEVAAALAALLRGRRRRSKDSSRSPGNPSDQEDLSLSQKRPPAWARLFLSIGLRDGVAPRDLLGAITGEADMRGVQVGRIDVKDGFSRVEVHDTIAERVIRALNGTSIRGRSVRVDYDRGESRPQRKAAPRERAPRRPGPKRKK
jgi:ATP-dependent RNA helicase DeaD